MAANHHPVGGSDYPRTLQEFKEFFSSEAARTDLLRRLRWPDGFLCPACNGHTAWTTARGQLRRVACQRRTSPIAGTISEGTRKPLRLWFWAIWFVANQKLGGSALGLHRLLGAHPGSVSDKHLDYYLDEFTFRFNRRHSRARGVLFYRLVQQAAQVAPVPYCQIVDPEPPK